MTVLIINKKTGETVKSYTNVVSVDTAGKKINDNVVNITVWHRRDKEFEPTYTSFNASTQWISLDDYAL